MEYRINSIDFLRGISVILMIIGHIYFIWPDVNNNLFEEIILLIVLIAPAFFLLISGFSFYIFIGKKINEKNSKLKIFYEVVKRAFFIFIISTIFQIFFGFILCMQITDIIYWSIFQIIAFSMIIFFIIPFLKYYLRIFLYFTLFFFIFFINFLNLFYEIGILYILVEQGTFPFIPWVSFYLVGIFIGDILINSRKKRINLILFNFSLIGIIIFIFWIIWGIKVQTLYISIFLESYCIFLIIFPICYFFLDIKEVEFFLSRSLTQWGKTAFSLYYIQFAIVAIGLIVFPLILNESILIFQFFLIITIILFALEFFLKIWRNFDYKYGIEWLMSKFTKKSLYYKNLNNTGINNKLKI